ncbi:MAG: glycosyltransferase family 2 protein [Flavobacteriales bacterium]
MTLSVVSTLYKSKPFLDQFLIEIIEAIDALEINTYEILFVNDGSPDDSLSFLIEKQKEISQIKIIDLSRNFGHHYAMQAGLSEAKGDYVFLIDNDLETPPSFLIESYNMLIKDETTDVVYGYQEERKGKFIENFGGRVFWWAINKFSDIQVPKNILTERIMTKRYVKSLLELGDANLFMGGMMHWTGYHQIGLAVQKKVREGESTYSASKRLQLMINALTSFSGKPLEYLFYFGLSLTFISGLTIIGIFIRKFILNEGLQLGWTSLITLNVMILGILSTFLGLMGIYIFKIFKQVQTRPNFIIKKIYE